MSENKRIAKNTLFLYIRMLFVMAVSLYSSRVVLNILGGSDYGLYNVVGGFVLMLSFLNGAASGATSRYLTFYLGKKDYHKYQQAFSAAFIIHLGIAFLIFALAETVGLWFLYGKMTIEPTRLEAAVWVFHLSVLSCFVTFTQVPYNASIISHERMNIYALVSIVEAFLKLFILYLLSVSPYDKLKSYAFLLFVISVAIAFYYRFYCKRNFKECRISRVQDKGMFAELLKYTGWDTLGSITGIAQTQGINVVLNMFFGTIVNAARGVAYQVDAAVMNFVQNFLTAINPQIVKAYAAGNYSRVINLMFFGGKYAFLLFSCMAVPIIIEAPYLLNLWLGNPPEYSVPFLRLVILNHFIAILCTVVNIVVHAAGDVKRLNIYAGTISIMKLPIAYTLLWFGLSPIWAFIGIIPVTCVCLWVDMRVLRMNMEYPQISFLWNTLVKNIFLIIIPTLFALGVSLYWDESFLRLCLVTVMYCILLLSIVYLFGMTFLEKEKTKIGLNQVKLIIKYNLNMQYVKNFLKGGGVKRLVPPSIRKAIKKKYVDHQIAKERKREEWLIINNISEDKLEPLTAEEKEQILNLWGGLCNNKMSFREYEIYKKVLGFDPRFLSHELYLPLVVRRLNDLRYTKFFENKGLLGMIPITGMIFPECCVKCIDGEFYDKNMQQLSRERAIEICIEQEDLLIKDSIDSSGGVSISKIELTRLMRKQRREAVEMEFNRRKDNYVVQRCIKQSKQLSVFCETSVNTMRITTLYLNGKFSVCIAVLRVGKKGSVVDNLCSGGYIVGINPDGSLDKFGYTNSLTKVNEINGVCLEGMKIECFPEIVRMIEKAHTTLYSLCKWIGWDITVDEKGNFVVIELNSSQSEISRFQIHGPVFGDRTEEVIAYCKQKEFVYNRSLFNY